MPRLELGLNTFYTESGAQRGGRGTGVTAVTNNYSMAFPGTNEYMTMTAPTLNDTFSVSAWAKWDAGATGGVDYDYIVSFGAAGTRTTGSIARHSTGEANKPYVFDGGSVLVGTNALAIGEWIHLAIVVKPTSDRLTLYINGSAETIDQPAGDFNISSSTGAVGSLGWANAHFIAGNVDEIAIWDTNLSSADITAIYNSGVPTDLTDSASYDTDRTGNLVCYWRFEEGTDSAITNTANPGTHDGTLQNGGAWDADVPS